MNKQNKKLGLILTIILISAICSSFVSFFVNFQIDNNDGVIEDFDNYVDDLKTSDNGNPPLSYSSFYQNTSSVYRLLESIKFNIDVSDFAYANYSIIKVDYPDDTVENFDMEHVSGTNNFTYTYSPKYNALLGFHNVTFLIYNVSDTLLSSDLPITNFTIYTNYLLVLNSSEYYKDNYLYAELIVSNEPQPYQFNWNITVVDGINEVIANNTFHVGNNVQQFSFKIDNRFEFSNKLYFIKLNISDISQNIRVAAYFPFNVLNSAPKIEISSIDFSSVSIKRAEDCTLTLNVTDDDYNTVPENLTVNITIKDSFGLSQSPIILDNNHNWSFTTTFSIDISKPIGIYQIIIEAEDRYGGTDSYTATITVENNLPKINSYSINGFSMEASIEVNYGENIIFTFNVSDVENSINYVTIHLINEKNEWYNLSRVYVEDMKFLIRTEELLTGVWYVYISVTDKDGDITYLSSDIGLGPQEINIIPDVLTPVLPFFGLAIGLIIGFLAGMGLLFRKFKSKYEEGKEISSKKAEKKPKQEKKEVKDEEIELKEPEIKEEPKESEEFKQLAQRTIKRKLK
jgi:hypothetical protein